MKSLGVIGGLGPETTAEFYLEVIFGCKEINPLALPHIVIGSVPSPYALMEKAINGTDENVVVETMHESLEVLKNLVKLSVENG